MGYSTIANSPDGRCDLVVNNGETLIPQLLEGLKAKGVVVESVSLKKPTLDDVFLKYTGARIEEGDTFAETRRARRAFTRRS
jgi:ABC-2 type transport system ATP-binding protein